VNYASGGRIPEAVELARKSEVALLFGGSSALIESIENVNPKTIVVLDRPERVDGVPAILVSWGRHDVGPVIFGRVNPSGKLPVTGPETMFAFGAGLSYTTFRYSDLQIFPRTPRYGQLVQAVLKVTNTGTRSGAEVVGLYVNQKLKAFRRVDLKPGESRTVSFELDRRAMSFYDPLVKTWATEPGVFEVLAGSSPRDIRLRGTFELFR
jgi:beta-glucosidase